jgi:NADH:ubiquinone oxidoreductase subunit E
MILELGIYIRTQIVYVLGFVATLIHQFSFEKEGRIQEQRCYTWSCPSWGCTQLILVGY